MEVLIIITAGYPVKFRCQLKRKEKKLNKDPNLPRNVSPSTKALTRPGSRLPRPFIYRPNPRQHAATNLGSWWGKGKHKDKLSLSPQLQILDLWPTCEN